MSAKVSNLDELASILTKKEKRDGGILHFSKQFKTGHLLKPFSGVKQQGFTLMSILVALILCRLGCMSIYAAQKTGNLHMDDNTMYRLMNNPLINRKSIILSFAEQFLRCAAKNGTSAEQYLRLGKSQNTDLCGQIADASLTLITCTILERYKRFEDYETLGQLFRITREELLERTLCGPYCTGIFEDSCRTAGIFQH
jgi:hypothetical protein